MGNCKKISVYFPEQVLSQQLIVNIILEPQLVLPIFVPNMPLKKSRNGAMNSIVLAILQKHNHMQPIQHLHTLF